MSEPMSFENWLKLTYAGMNREAKLMAVDGALKQYHKTQSQADKERLRSALMDWIMEKGPAWKQDVRNSQKAIEDLCSQVMTQGEITRLSHLQKEIIGLSHLEREPREALDKLFRDKKLVWREGFSAKLANCKWGVRINAPSAATNAFTLATGGSASGSSFVSNGVFANFGNACASVATQVANDVLNAWVPAEIQPEVLLLAEEVIPDFMRELIKSVAPFVGVFTAGGSAVWNLKNAFQNEYRRKEADKHLQGSLSVGDPKQAIEAIIRIIKRERNADLFSGSVSLAAFAGMLVAGGTATNAPIGLAGNLFKLGNIIRIIVRDVRAKNAGNDLMREGPQITAFETCPILGAYYVCCVPTSVLVNEILERWWKGGWQGEVKNAVTKHIEPLRGQARRLIGEHRFVINELQSYPGVLARNQKAIEEMKTGPKMPSISFVP